MEKCAQLMQSTKYCTNIENGHIFEYYYISPEADKHPIVVDITSIQMFHTRNLIAMRRANIVR